MKEESKNEKDIFEILAEFENELEEKLKKSDREIKETQYYEEIDINKINFRNIFITAEEDSRGNITRHIYCAGEYLQEILSIDADGKIHVNNPEVSKYIKKVDLEEVVKKNKSKIKGISKSIEPDELEKEDANQEDNKQDSKQDKTGDLEISKYRKIKDSHIHERIPGVFENGEENGIAFSNKLNRFVIISKVNGEYKLNENIEPARMTWKSIISVDAEGKSVERKVPHALMKIPGDINKEIAVTIDNYGYVDVETVKRTTIGERVSREVRVDGQGIDEEESKEIRREFETQGITYERDIAEQVQNIENEKTYNITEEDYIPNTDITWGELKRETGESLLELVERYNRELDKKGDSKKAVETIEYDYQTISHDNKKR